MRADRGVSVRSVASDDVWFAAIDAGTLLTIVGVAFEFVMTSF
jgi:hypothetical protein